MSHKIVYLVEYSPTQLPDGTTFYEQRILDHEYPREDDPSESHAVTKIEEEFEYGKKLVTVFYDDGCEDSIYGISKIFRKLK